MLNVSEFVRMYNKFNEVIYECKWMQTSMKAVTYYSYSQQKFQACLRKHAYVKTVLILIKS